MQGHEVVASPHNCPLPSESQDPAFRPHEPALPQKSWEKGKEKEKWEKSQ
jgi:hypothetical protein